MINNINKLLPINELYYAIQMEGSRQGKPTVIIRFVGCTHTCHFGNSWCDSPQSSYNINKDELKQYTYNDIINMYKKRPDITEMMITGGSPTLYPDIINELVCYAYKNNIIVTLETEGSHFIVTDYPINLVSISPKLKNTIPPIGIKMPNGKIVNKSIYNRHIKYRMNINAMSKMIENNEDYQLKFVFDNQLESIEEIEMCINKLGAPKHKVWIMPKGDTIDVLIPEYSFAIEYCLKNGYNFTGRDHIIAYNNKRFV